MLAPLLVLASLAFAQTESTISIPSADGAITVDSYGRGDRVVVLAHGGRFDRTNWKPQARVLAAAGFRAVALDFRAAVASRGGQDAPCLYDAACLAKDVLAVVRHLRREGVRQVSLVGGSLGGGASAQAAVDSAPGEIDRVVLLAHMSIAKPEAMGGRKLFVVARADLNAGGQPRLDAIRDQFDRAPQPKRLLVLEGSAHAQFMFESDQGPMLMQEIIKFLESR